MIATMLRFPVHSALRWWGLLLATVVIVLTPTPSLARDEITWLEVNMPPYFIQEGPHLGQGYGNVIGALIEQQLPEYEHHRLVTNVIRHFDMFKRGDKVCMVGLYRTPERESFLHFSMPSMITMPAVLVVRKDRLHLYAGRVASLAEVLRNREFRLGLSSDRSYGTGVDAVLKEQQQANTWVRFSGQELGENYLKMLLLDRLDGVLALPDEAMYHAGNMGIHERIALVPLSENQKNPAGWMCTVACPKNEWGREVIDRINEVLVRVRPTAPYRQAYERWLDTNALDRYRNVYDTIFLTTRP